MSYLLNEFVDPTRMLKTLMLQSLNNYALRQPLNRLNTKPTKQIYYFVAQHTYHRAAFVSQIAPLPRLNTSTAGSLLFTKFSLMPFQTKTSAQPAGLVNVTVVTPMAVIPVAVIHVSQNVAEDVNWSNAELEVDALFTVT